MGAQFTTPLITVIPGQLIASSLWNGEFNNISTNFIPGGMDSYSDTDAQMQIQTNPFPGSITSHASSLGGEIERIRYQIAQITGKTYWYNAPDISIANTMNSLVPVGGIIDYPSVVLPNNNWHACDGQALNRVIYATLFSLIGTTFGIGDGTTTFNLPDFRNRVSIAAGSIYGVGDVGGANTHTHTQTGHSHTVDSHTHTISHNHNLPLSYGGNSGDGLIYTPSTWAPGTWTGTSGWARQALAGGGPSSIFYFKSDDSNSANSGANDPGTDTQTPAIDPGSSLPPYIGMYKMMRII